MRYMSQNQNPDEDKLQIKNLIYHSVKNALSTVERLSPTSVKPETDSPSHVKEEDC